MTTNPKKPRRPRAVSPSSAGNDPAAKPQRRHRAKAAGAPAPKGPSRGEQMMAMVQRPGGASLAELVEAFGVLPHSARAVISVESRKRGLTAKSVDGRLTIV